MRILGIVALGAALGGCASAASDIAPAYVSPVAYQGYTCQQLALEAQAISTRAATLSGAQDKQRTDTQARKRLIKIWVFNSQNVTPDVQRINDIAREEEIPIATVTETLSPASDSFEQWQVAELEGIARALHEATGH